MEINKAGTGFAALALLAGMSGFTSAPSDNPPGCDPNAPGSCDKYSQNDPYVHGQVNKAPAKTIVMSNFTFIPDKVTVKAGDKWTEDNEDVATHNITTAKLAEKPPNKNYTGGDIAPDVMSKEKKTFKMPTKKGTYKTVCFYHQNMALTIIVK